MDATPRFTSAQILQAGMRAESEGNHEHARQYYTHILHYFPESSEAASADEGMRRMAEQARQPRFQSETLVAARPEPHYAQPHTQPPPRQSPSTAPPARAGSAPQAAPASPYAPNPNHQAGFASPAPPPQAPYTPPQFIANATAVTTHPPASRALTQTSSAELELADLDHEPQVRRYTVGRWIAGGAVLLGWFSILAALGTMATAVALGSKSSTVVGIAIGVVPAAIMAVSGLLMLLVGQIANAIFDGSAAVQSMSAHEHAKKTRR